jgi:hypothetical protein
LDGIGHILLLETIYVHHGPHSTFALDVSVRLAVLPIATSSFSHDVKGGKQVSPFFGQGNSDQGKMKADVFFSSKPHF